MDLTTNTFDSYNNSIFRYQSHHILFKSDIFVHRTNAAIDVAPISKRMKFYQRLQKTFHY